MTASHPLVQIGCLMLLACADRREGRTASDTLPARPRAGAVMVERFGPYIFAASGVAQLPDGRLLVVEDKKWHPLVLVDLFGRGGVKEFAPDELTRATGEKWLSDLEGITSDDQGHLYAVTSHSLSASGAEHAERDLLVRFEIHGDSITNARVASRLKAAITALHPVLARGAHKRPKGKGAGLNIEGIAWDASGERLLLGLRSPLIEESAIVVSLDNPAGVFDSAAAPRVSGPFRLALDGEGIRDLTWDKTLGGYLVVAGSARRSKRSEAALWLWRGGSAPILLDAPAVAGLKPEGIAIVNAARERAVLLVCDDGHEDGASSIRSAGANSGTPSRYVLIPYDTLLARNSSRLAATHSGSP